MFIQTCSMELLYMMTGAARFTVSTLCHVSEYANLYEHLNTDPKEP